MKQKLLRSGVYFCLLVMSNMIVFPGIAASGWFDKFKGTVVSSNASAWSLQQYGHFAGGGFSMRYSTGNRSLVHVSAPRISVGCGGIDAFWGGFSFLNPEYYVQMFRNIIQAAPAFAFELALKSLCEPCAAVMDALNEIAQAMNALSVDECGISRAIAHAGADAVAERLGWSSSTGSSDGSGPAWLTSLKEFAGKATKFATDVKEMLSHKFCSHLSGDAKKSCLVIYGTSGTFWQRILEYENMTKSSGETKFDAEAIEVMRAITGDISFTAEGKDKDGKDAGDKDPKIPGLKPEPSTCPDQASAARLVELMLKKEYTDNDKIFVWPLDASACMEKSLPSSLRIAELASKGVTDIKNLIMTNPTGTLTNEAKTIINQNTLPLYKLINLYSLRHHTMGTAFVSQGEEEVMVQLAALGHAAFIVQSALRYTNTLMAMIASELLPAAGAAGVPDKSIPIAMAYFQNGMTMIQQELHVKLNNELKKHYDAFNNVATVIRLQQSLEENVFDNMYKKI